jgi:hypothetical protein
MVIVLLTVMHETAFVAALALLGSIIADPKLVGAS